MNPLYPICITPEDRDLADRILEATKRHWMELPEDFRTLLSRFFVGDLDWKTFVNEAARVWESFGFGSWWWTQEAERSVHPIWRLWEVLSRAYGSASTLQGHARFFGALEALQSLES